MEDIKYFEEATCEIISIDVTDIITISVLKGNEYGEGEVY